MVLFFSKNFSGLLLSLAIAAALYTPFSHWAINSEFFGRHDMGLALFFSVTFPVAVFVSCLIAVVSLLFAFASIKSGKQYVLIFLMAASIALLAPAYVLLLDI